MVQCHPVKQAVVLLFEECRDFFRRASHRIDLKHVIRNLFGHSSPFAFGGFFTQPSAGISPAMHVEHRFVGPGRSVKGDLHPHLFTHLIDLFLAVAHDDKG